ncbi:MAG: M6 family metalloprotease domain-containing protein [Bacteroides sp.]|nr:M6 family metalloprotease domain-containing protein [Bacteroides sp.]MCM1379505.1 M6 family metalloprotease domain-containing protein [Bacteroides sp.]MCM1445892.1 M6 family metalloprotease domain-containing protein [Prevotella sp.]
MNRKLITAIMTAALVLGVAVSAMAATKVRDQITNYPTMGERHVLVILAQFPDKKFHNADPAKVIGDMLNKEGYSDFGATGSVRDYFVDNSCGQYTPIMDVYGPVTLPREMAYYGGMTSTANDARPREMIRDACQLLDDEINFRDYDLDGDGYIDNVYLFYAGYSQADGADPNTVWPHASYAWNELRAEFDGVKLDHYACSNEVEFLTGNLVGIGSFCHEFSHVLGLPDLYPTDYSHSQTAGTWSLLASGGYNNNCHTPPYLTAYERYALGWLTAEELTADGKLHTLSDISTNSAYKIATSNPDEYFLIEYRRKAGWDAYLPGEGLLVWHIDYDKDLWANNKVNNDAKHQRISLVAADNILTDETRPADAYPGSGDVTELSNLKCFGATVVPIGLFNIKESEENATVQFNVIATDSKLADPQPLEPTELTPISAKISWQPVEGAESYIVDVYTKNRSGSYTTRSYVSGYRLAEVQGTSLTVEGLQPESDYNYCVRAMGGTHISDYCREQTLTTLNKDFTFFAPEAKEVTGVDDTSFTANWEALAEADDYEVNVYEVNYGATVNESNDIADFTNDWYLSSATTSVFPGYFGEEAPGLSFTANDDYIRSPLHSDMEVSKISFWYRGTSVQDGNELEILGYTASNEWKLIKSISPVLRESGGYVETISKLSFPCSAIAITYRRPRNVGSVAIDDVEVEYNAAELTPVSNFTAVKTGNNLSLNVTGLKPATNYRFEVRGLSGSRQSLYSVGQNVRTLDESAIVEIKNNTTANAEMFDLTGRSVKAGSTLPHGVYIIRTDRGNVKTAR